MTEHSQASGIGRNLFICVTLTLLLIALFVVVLLPQYLLWLLARRAQALIGRAAAPHLSLVE